MHTPTITRRLVVPSRTIDQYKLKLDIRRENTPVQPDIIHIPNRKNDTDTNTNTRRYRSGPLSGWLMFGSFFLLFLLSLLSLPGLPHTIVVSAESSVTGGQPQIPTNPTDCEAAGGTWKAAKCTLPSSSTGASGQSGTGAAAKSSTGTSTVSSTGAKSSTGSTVNSSTGTTIISQSSTGSTAVINSSTGSSAKSSTGSTMVTDSSTGSTVTADSSTGSEVSHFDSSTGTVTSDSSTGATQPTESSTGSTQVTDDSTGTLLSDSSTGSMTPEDQSTGGDQPDDQSTASGQPADQSTGNDQHADESTGAEHPVDESTGSRDVPSDGSTGTSAIDESTGSSQQSEDSTGSNEPPQDDSTAAQAADDKSTGATVPETDASSTGTVDTEVPPPLTPDKTLQYCFNEVCLVGTGLEKSEDGTYPGQQTVTGIKLSLLLQLDLQEWNKDAVGNGKRFIADLAQSITPAMPVSRINIVSVSSGSTVITMELVPGSGIEPSAATLQIVQQVNYSKSSLYREGSSTNLIAQKQEVSFTTFEAGKCLDGSWARDCVTTVTQDDSSSDSWKSTAVILGLVSILALALTAGIVAVVIYTRRRIKVHPPMVTRVVVKKPPLPIDVDESSIVQEEPANWNPEHSKQHWSLSDGEMEKEHSRNDSLSFLEVTPDVPRASGKKILRGVGDSFSPSVSTINLAHAISQHNQELAASHHRAALALLQQSGVVPSGGNFLDPNEVVEKMDGTGRSSRPAQLVISSPSHSHHHSGILNLAKKTRSSGNVTPTAKQLGMTPTPSEMDRKTPPTITPPKPSLKPMQRSHSPVSSLHGRGSKLQPYESRSGTPWSARAGSGMGDHSLLSFHNPREPLSAPAMISPVNQRVKQTFTLKKKVQLPVHLSVDLTGENSQAACIATPTAVGLITPSTPTPFTLSAPRVPRVDTSTGATSPTGAKNDSTFSSFSLAAPRAPNGKVHIALPISVPLNVPMPISPAMTAMPRVAAGRSLQQMIFSPRETCSSSESTSPSSLVLGQTSAVNQPATHGAASVTVESNGSSSSSATAAQPSPISGMPRPAGLLFPPNTFVPSAISSLNIGLGIGVSAVHSLPSGSNIDSGFGLDSQTQFIVPAELSVRSPENGGPNATESPERISSHPGQHVNDFCDTPRSASPCSSVQSSEPSNNGLGVMRFRTHRHSISQGHISLSASPSEPEENVVAAVAASSGRPPVHAGPGHTRGLSGPVHGTARNTPPSCRVGFAAPPKSPEPESLVHSEYVVSSGSGRSSRRSSLSASLYEPKQRGSFSHSSKGSILGCGDEDMMDQTPKQSPRREFVPVGDDTHRRLTASALAAHVASM